MSLDDVYVPEDEEDETLMERLVGLTEMFPQPVRESTLKGAETLWFTIKKAYSWTTSISWVIFSTSVICLAPVMFEAERFSLEEAQKLQQRKMLLGPGAAMGSNSGLPR